MLIRSELAGATVLERHDYGVSFAFLPHWSREKDSVLCQQTTDPREVHLCLEDGFSAMLASTRLEPVPVLYTVEGWEYNTCE